MRGELDGVLDYLACLDERLRAELGDDYAKRLNLPTLWRPGDA